MGKMLKHWVFVIGMCLFTVAVNAETIKQGNSKDVEMLLDAASGKNSAYWATYIGTAMGRFYIAYESMAHASSVLTKKAKHVVYWFPEESLSEEVMSTFIEYKKAHSRTRQNAEASQ